MFFLISFRSSLISFASSLYLSSVFLIKNLGEIGLLVVEVLLFVGLREKISPD